jgi:hypothetical protein
MAASLPKEKHAASTRAGLTVVKSFLKLSFSLELRALSAFGSHAMLKTYSACIFAAFMSLISCVTAVSACYLGSSFEKPGILPSSDAAFFGKA